jgi:hypothetical protein
MAPGQRGIIPRKRPLWFEEGSSFRTMLTACLGEKDICCKINAFTWSGANSIWERDKAASRLAKLLEEAGRTNQGAPQLIIAHSHGGNVALRALSRLAPNSLKRHTEQRKPLLVTMATPFIEVFPVHSISQYTVLTRLLILMVFTMGFSVALSYGVQTGWVSSWLGILLNGAALVGFFYLWIRSKIGSFRREQIVHELMDATRLKSDNAGGLLVLRAIDDEASLTIAFGAILNRTIPIIAVLLVAAFAIGVNVIGAVIAAGNWRQVEEIFGQQSSFLETFFNLAFFISHIILEYTNFPLFVYWLIPGLLILLFAGRFVYGREMVTAPFESQVNSQSTPDGTCISNVITLMPSRVSRGLRHKIYDHESILGVIANWTRAQL